MEFLKRHYEKIVLCVVLLGLAAAVMWMRTAIGTPEQGQPEGPPQGASPRPGPGRRGAARPGSAQPATPKVMDLSEDVQSLAQMTNPPTVILSGAHNLFNPVTWKRKTNGELFKVLQSGPEALRITDIIPLYTVISYDRPSAEAGVYVLSVQEHVEGQQVGTTAHKTTEYVKKDQKPKRGFYIIRGIKGAENEPSELNLEIPQTGETNVWIATNNPYKRVDSYLVDLKYDPETKVLSKQRVDDWIKLDNEPYKIVEITSNAVRVESSTTKVTEIKWTESHKKE
jgi:hypothetical protein